ncbi:hypothetical protein MJO28_008178 [Puccinia striiformis f. sp. tritici]|uniref:Uncharacterized protein n=1 Tax=Puccinia striiformis f. sp. tritici TaxID=168172 RepID=A0ACC0EAA3_9BASI|nr:hypothetical protein MJO28_008178 [Puccinia striiformis f. sp. tritici]
MDHHLWNDRLYYHSKAPWAIDVNVLTGITATLTLKRVQEEFELLAQELCQAIGWGVLAYYKRMEDTAQYLQGRLATMHLGNVPLVLDYNIDAIPLHTVGSKRLYKLLSQELHQRLVTHGTLMDEWSKTYPYYGVTANQKEIGGAQVGVDEQLEATVLEINVDDGKDVETTLISRVEEGNSEENNVPGSAQGTSRGTDAVVT